MQKADCSRALQRHAAIDMACDWVISPGYIMTVKIIFSRREITVAAAMIALCISLLAPVGPAISADPNEKEIIALSLANLLRAARSVISDNQDLINDHTQGFKGLTSDMVMLTAKEYYEIATGLDIDDVERESMHGRLLQAEIEAINEVIDEVQERINRKGVGFKGILPSIFAASVAAKFREKAGDRAQLRITAPRANIRNSANGPDNWRTG